MKKIFTTILLITILVSLSIAASPSEAEFTYDFVKTEETNNIMHYSSSILLTVITPTETTCRYTTVSGSQPSNEFDRNYGTKHEKVFDELEDGIHKYYIKCGDNISNPITKMSFKTKKPVSADIQISKESPLKAGNYDITLTTSSHVISIPTLEYSFDGKTFNPLPLEGEDKNFKGHLIIGKNSGEVIGSFRFKGTDLDGKEGTKITGDKIFEVDTKAPSVIQTIEAIGYEGQVKLSWYLDEEIEEYRIYKSSEPNVDHTDFLEETDDNEYIDNEVKKGKTYYYRVAAVDSANNIGPMSIELTATALINNVTQRDTGLSQKLVGKVDNLITEINLLKEDINTIKNAIANKGEKEKSIFEDLNLEKEFTDTLSEIDSLKKDVERFKLQNLDEIELDKKINSARVKMDIFEKKVPESITIIEEKEITRELNEEITNLLTLDYGQETFTPKEIRKTVSQTMKLLKELEMKISSKLYNLEIIYLDGTKQEKALITDTVTAQLERNDEIKYLLQIPKSIAETASEINFLSKGSEVIKEDPLIGFDADIREIKYTINKHISPDSLTSIKQGPLHFYKENLETGLMTGFVTGSNQIVSTENIVYIVLTLFMLLLFLYFLAIKRSEPQIIKEKIKEAKKHKKNKEHKKLFHSYNELKGEYKKLSKKEKDKYYKKIKKLHGK